MGSFSLNTPPALLSVLWSDFHYLPRMKEWHFFGGGGGFKMTRICTRQSAFWGVAVTESAAEGILSSRIRRTVRFENSRRLPLPCLQKVVADLMQRELGRVRALRKKGPDTSCIQ